MSSTQDHFKEPLAKLDQLITKLQTNLGEALVIVPDQTHVTEAKPVVEVATEKQPEPIKIEKPAEEVKPVEPVAETKVEAAPAAIETKEEQPKPKKEKTKEPKQEKPKEEKPKEAKEQKPKEPTTVVVDKPKDAHEELTATVDDFLQLDIRIGSIKECWKVSMLIFSTLAQRTSIAKKLMLEMR